MVRYESITIKIKLNFILLTYYVPITYINDVVRRKSVVNSDDFLLYATIIVATIDNMHIRRKYELDIYTRKSRQHCYTLVAK